MSAVWIVSMLLQWLVISSACSYVAVDVGLGNGDSWVQGDFNFSGTVTATTTLPST